MPQELRDWFEPRGRGGIAMIRSHNFRGVRFTRPNADAVIQKPNSEELHRRVSERIVEPFSLVSGAVAVIADVNPPALERDEEPPPNPGHPLCADYVDSDYCRESWQLHLAELTSNPRTHCHKCDFGLHCAVVPIVCNRRCSAALKLSCASDESEQRFESLVGVLDVLVRDFAAGEADFLEALACPEPTAETRPFFSADGSHVANKKTGHPLVLKAIQYIEKNLTNPQLTVGRASQALGVSSNYLSHLFAAEVGRRMGCFIIDRRVERGKRLLSTTERQIKQIAYETGHGNPKWFSRVFCARTGVTPAEYRARTRRSIA